MQLEFEILGKVLIAIILCGVIGYEREMVNKPAGLRTQMIVGGASSLLMLLGNIYIYKFSTEEFNEIIRIDPLRIFQAIIMGVSFIGAGTVLKTQDTTSENEPSPVIKYLTTAATILFSASVGICVSLDKYIIAVGITIIVLIINIGVRRFEKKR